MINKNQFRVDSDKKVLHKIGKRWVTVSVAMLALLGGSLVMGHKTTHADATTPSAKAQNTNNTKKVLNQSLQKNYNMNVKQKSTVASAKPSSTSARPSASAIQSSAKAMYGNIVRNAAKPSAKSDAMNTLNLGTPSEQAKRVQHGINNNDYARVNQPKSSVVNNSTSNDRTTSVSSASAKTSTASSNSVSAPAKPSFNSAYQSYMAQMSGVDSEVAKDNKGNIQSDTKNKKKPLIKDSNDGLKPESYYFSGGIKDTGSDNGLNYTAYNNGGVEFTGGTAKNSFDKSHLPYGEVNTWIYSDSFNRTVYNSDLENATAMKFDNNINLSHVTDMSNMFNGISDLELLDLGNNFDTSHVTNMSDMFGATNLQSLNLGDKFDTSHVTNMQNMFRYNFNLHSLNLGDKFDTSNVTNMGWMFQATALQSLNLGDKFDTSHVTDMGGMFQSDTALQSLNLGDKFDTSHVTDVDNMFLGDTALQSLNLGDKFDTSHVTDMGGMFLGDTALQSLNLGDKFDTSKATNWGDMFQSDKALQSLTIDSPHTKFNNGNLPQNSNNVFYNFYQLLPEKDKNGKNYTLSTPNDFSKGNVGTFILDENPAPASDNATISFKDNNGNLIPFKYNNQTVTSATLPKQKFATPINLNNLLPNNYELVNPSQSVVADGDTHAVSVKLNYDEIINSLVNEAGSESAAINGDNKELNSDNNTIASYKDSSASISNAIANADNAENWVKSYSASVSNAYNSANDADKWVHSNSSSAQNADSWVANNSSNAAHASNQATTNSSAINSLNGRTSNDETSLSNNIATASTIASEASAKANTDSNSITSLSTSANANHSADSHNIVSLSTSANSQAKSYAGSLSASVASASTAINSALSNANHNASALNNATSSSASNAIASASASASSSVSSADNSINASLSNVKASASASASSAYSNAVIYANTKYATESGARSSAVSSLNTSIASASARALSSANSAYSAASTTASQDGSKAYSSASSLVNSASSAASSSVSSALTSATTYASNSIGSLQSSASNKAASYANSLSGQINSLSGSTNAKVTSLSSGVSSNSTAIASNSTAETSLINSLQSSASNAIASADTKATNANGTATKNFNSSMNSLQSSLASETSSASASASSAYSNAVSYANSNFATKASVDGVKSSLNTSIANASARALASANSAYNAGASVANANYSSATSLINSASAKASSSVSSALSSATTYVSNSISSLSGSTSADSATLNSKINSASTNDSNAASASASSAYSNASSYANSLRTSASGSITIVLNSLNSHINNSYASAITSAQNMTSDAKKQAIATASASASSAYSNAKSYVNSLNKTANGSINGTIDKLNRSIATNSAAISGNAKNISNNTNEINHLKSDGSITLAFSVGDDVVGGKNGTYITLDDNEVRSQPKYNNSSDTYVITNLLKDDIPSGYHINGNVYAKVKSLNDGFAQIQLLGNAPRKLNATPTVSVARELTKPANVQRPRQLGVARPMSKLGGFRNLGAEQSQDHVIPLVGNGVTYNGTVTLKYNANGKTVKTIQEPYTVTTEVGNQVTLLNPNDYINKTMNGFDTHNYNPSDTNDYQTFTVDPNAAPSDTNPTYSKDYTLNFNAQGIKDTIIYDLSNTNTPAGYQGKTGDIKTITPSGTYDTGVASNTITNGVPTNYHIVSGNNGIQYDGNTHTVEVAPNMETVSISYNDTDNGGSIVGADNSKVGNQGKTYTQNINVPYDTKISDITKDVNIPSGYSYSGGNKTYVVNGNGSQSDAISIKGNQETNDVTVTINKIDGGKTATSTKMVQVSGATGTQYSINPSDKAYQPDGYGVESSTESGTFDPNNQLSNPTMTFNYNAQQGGAITVNYINQHGAKQTETINGNTDDTGKISDKAPVPAGYNANDGQATTYHVLPHTQTITIHTTGEPASAVDKTNHGKITVYINKVSGGKSINNGGTPVTVDLSGKSVGDSYTIKSSSYTPNGYTDNSNNINGTVTPNGLSTDDYTKPQMTFTYRANAGATISVKYVNQDGATVNSGQITGPVDETGSVTNAVSLPSDYTVNNGQNQTYTITTNQQNLTYHVTGKPAKATINFVNQDNDPAGSTTVSGETGDTVKPNGNQYPSGYVIPNPAPSYKFNQGGQNAPITVHITGKTASDANGSKSTNYKPTDKNDKNSTDTNAKRGYATITVVEKATNGNVLHTIIDTVNENDKRVGDSYTITPADVHPNGYDADSSDANLTGVIKSDGSLSNPTATFDYTVDASNIEPINIAYENQNHKFIDPTSGELVGDQQDATYTISAEELAKLGNAGDTVDITGYLKTPRGYHFTTAKDLIVDVNGQRLDAITLEKKQLGMARPLMLLSLWTPKPKKPAKPVKPSSATKPKKSASAKPSSAPAAPSASSRPKLILPSDGIAPTNRARIIPSDNTSKPSSHAKRNHSGIVNGKAKNKPSKSENQPNMNEHNRRVNRNKNVIPSDANVTPLVADRNASRASYANAEPVHVNVPKPTVATTQHNNNGKLPQTNEAGNASAIAAVMMLLTGISFAGVDLDRKHSI